MTRIKKDKGKSSNGSHVTIFIISYPIYDTIYCQHFFNNSFSMNVNSVIAIFLMLLAESAFPIKKIKNKKLPVHDPQVDKLTFNHEFNIIVLDNIVDHLLLSSCF